MPTINGGHYRIISITVRAGTPNGYDHPFLVVTPVPAFRARLLPMTPISSNVLGGYHLLIATHGTVVTHVELVAYCQSGENVLYI